MFLKENAFLLIDEPTNHLDLEGREKLAAYLSRKRGFLLVSHDRAFLDRCVDHILAINRTGIEVRRGGFLLLVEDRQRQDAFELARQEKLNRDISRLEESARRTSAWSDRTEKSKFGLDKTGARTADRGFVGHRAAKLMCSGPRPSSAAGRRRWRRSGSSCGIWSGRRPWPSRPCPAAGDPAGGAPGCGRPVWRPDRLQRRHL